LTSLKMKDFGLINGNPHSPHLVVGCRTRKLMTSVPKPEIFIKYRIHIEFKNINNFAYLMK
jgi:hypothetical protein